ncbi:MAG: hypothetical protein IJK08_08765 [Prevotella sp.]|nr:hypothetical protein [Prevotella sp.]
MKKLAFMFVAMAALSFAACTETKAPEAPVEEAVTEAVEEVADSAAAAVDSVAAAATEAVDSAAAAATETVEAAADAAAEAAK